MDSAETPSHTQPLAPADRHVQNLKRRYLSFLPPPQIIEICLTFEPHAPLHVQSSIWPSDLNAAITSLEALVRPPPKDDPPFKSPLLREEPPVMASLSDPAEVALAPTDDRSSTCSDDSKPLPQETPVSQTAASAQPMPPQSHPPSQAQQPPHLPYLFSPYHHAAYHAPSHAPFPSYLSHPHPHHPSLPPPAPPHASQAVYGPPPGHYLPGPSQIPHPHPYPGPTLVHGPQIPDPLPSSSDDLPSYEDMIVEALMESGDPEGCMPKSIFNWMASRYPLQSNFRPSASQALQKAYKRGRLEKGTGGRYRMNASWEGGSTSRRTTRRPQTQSLHNGTALQPQHRHPPPAGSPFTHAPHHTLAGSHAYQQPHPGYPYAPPPSSAAYPPQPHTAQPNLASVETTGDGGDTWRAAQTILKAINLGELLGIDQDHADEASHPAPGGPSSEPVDGRAELQAQLALLAAQLSEIAEADAGVSRGGVV